ncbi:MAG TPA: MEDS domain-containing protein [Mycobacteriales bacterium]|nr:MEDS domain-containing protein [Mycobacteriales bacterium]
MARSSSWTPSREPTVADHACWSYSSDAERAAIAVQWLADGMRIGQRGLYVGEAPVDVLIDELAALPDVAAALASGALVVQSSTDLYDLSKPVDSPHQLAIYDAGVRAAVAAGYRGVRVAADVTPLVLDPSRHESHVRWEQYADRYITEHPMAPMCMYDSRRVAGIDAIACVHPLQGPAAPVFGLYAVGPHAAALSGEVDALQGAAFGEALAGLPNTDTALHLDRLAFIDGDAAWQLHEVVRRRHLAGNPLSLIGAPPALRRTWRALEFEADLLVSS